MKDHACCHAAPNDKGHARGHGPAHAGHAAAKTKDPVCGMTVDPATAKHTLEHAAKTYYFCSKGCKAKFDANPGQFTK